MYGYFWVSNTRIAYAQDDGGNENIHIFAVNIDGTNDIDLTPFDNIQARLTDDLEAYIVDLGDASRISAVISKNFNAVELIGLREMMLHRQYDKIDAYEKEWRKKHKISEGQPSTLCQTRNSKKDLEIKQINSNTNNLKVIK